MITPGLPLEQGSVYTFTLSGEDQSYSWAVQTKSPVSLTALRPGDQQLAVPLDSPVELVLSTTLQVDLDLLAEYLHISPQVEGSFEQSGRVLRFTPQEEWEPATVYRLSLKEGLPFEDSSLLLEESYTWSFETQRSSDTWTLSAASSFLPDENPLFRVKGLSCPAGQGKVTVLASLYKFADTLSYAESLSRVAEQYPVWSESFRCLGGTAVDQCQLLFSSALALEGSADGKEQLLELDSLPEGCYMLRLMQGSSVRDAFFMVSPLSVYSLRDHDQALFWSFDESRDGQPLRAAVADLWGGDRNVADADGLSMLTVGEQALISVSDENRELIFPLWTTVEEPVYPNVWRYLSSDKKVYSNGDTIHFYGMLATRDGSKLDYERVSVYILPQGAGLEDAIYRGYAELEEGVFSGSLALPQLLPGAYSLQVWQSGLLYIESSFLVNSDSNYLLPSPGLSEEQTAVPLELGAEYRVPGPEQGTSRLYVQASGGLL
ncbi:MAG: Ig-like domain-containing protein, partial [Bacillota bacterium]|nr:Ig-like domain-containing protein [Bacillota bacterium]